MIVKSLPRLETGKTINAANLYTVYTNIWIEREEEKHRILDKDLKLQLMLELAWRMWNEENYAIHYRDLTPFIEKLVADKVTEFGDEEAEDVAREMQTATFLKRDEDGSFSFVHRSFMEYFLARKIREATFMLTVLNTRRLDRKVVYFLTLLDEADAICAPLQQVLKNPYSSNVSENALQILYWSGRIRCGMEDEISSHQTLQQELLTRIPRYSRLGGAKLQEIVLEGAVLVAAGAAGRLQFWDLEKGETFLYLYSFGPEAWLALLPDGPAYGINSL